MASQMAMWCSMSVSTVAKKTPYLVPKGGRFYFRVRIPDELRASFGKKEHCEALGDLNKAQAEVRVAQLGAQWQGLFLTERHRLGLASSPPISVPDLDRAFRPAVLEEVRAVAAAVSRNMLQLDEEARIDGWANPQDPDLGPVWEPEEAVKNVLSGRDIVAFKDHAEDNLSVYGLELPTGAAEQRRALYAWAQVIEKAVTGGKLRDEGKAVETPPVPTLPDSIQPEGTTSLSPTDKPAHLLMLRDVLELWKNKAKRPSGKTIETAERIVGQFEKVCGNPPLQKLNRIDGLKFRDWLLGQGLSAKTAADRLDYVCRLIRFEMGEQQRLTVNPWATIKIEGANESVTKRRPVKVDKLIQLFSIRLFQAYELPTVRTAGRDAAYWLPIMGAFTGARVTELAQLLVADILKEGALWCISINDEESWQSVKNSPSKRIIPMHSELVRLGLPEYVDAMRLAGHSRLFPMAPVSALNNAGGPFATWFSKLKSANGWGPENTFHSFRHTIETLLKRKKMYPFDINAYTGHKQPGGDADTTYSHPEPLDLVEVAEAVQYECLELPRVFPPKGWRAPPALSGLLMTRPRLAAAA